MPQDRRVSDPLVQQLIGAVQEVTVQSQAFNAKLDALTRSEKTTRKEATESHDLARKLVVAFVFLFVIAAGLGGVAWQAHEASEDAKAAVKSNCTASNEARALQITLWEYILNQPPSRQLSAEEMKARDAQILQFRGFLNKTYAPRKC